MAVHEVELVASENVFVGLSKQNMLFHQCIGELIDNAIAASDPTKLFRIQIVMAKDAEIADRVHVWTADNGAGMDLEILSKALQLGAPPVSSSRLNEHGFGLKNALATLSGGNGEWQIWSRRSPTEPVCEVARPFGNVMKIDDDSELPATEYLEVEDFSTIVHVPVKLGFIQSVQGRGAPAKDLGALRQWLIEHIGVMYRGYLELDPTTMEPAGTITVSVANDRLRVPLVPVPMPTSSTSTWNSEAWSTSLSIGTAH